MEIKKISKEKTWNLRHTVMWPNKELDYIKLDQDDSGIHYGLFEKGRLISVVSLFIENEDAQFRKFATLQSEQGKGFGSKLLNHVVEEAKRVGIKRIWCNARLNKSSFYKKFGLQESEHKFQKGGLDYVIMERLLDV
ncbi:GNAT family N-acetyltransferase [Chengkuizengella axinellae]|uniref:GNAT family N-acetyltransferase n=1 Tax=Chengkuizengella axinellae TaxID=3064388 RepID=A0ABT9IUN5_9BACL|nr:GNAT family N-acetyltransferase [Chengkuizengella sp. 2205SS18-9]MDP5273068.1 GNAT family N-acetyltransferase [Chengkuizengella sp. 2205SS18-9]